MKKIMMLLIVAVLMLGVSGQAMASFENGHLVRVVYSSEGVNEIATDMGDISGLTSPSTALKDLGGSYNFATLGGGANASNTYVSYFAYVNTATTKHAWISGVDGGQTASKSGFSGFVTKAGTATGAYGVFAPGATQVVYNMSNADSFWSQVTASGASIGKFGTFIPSGTGAGLVSQTGYVDNVLYYYAAPSGIGTATSVNVSKLRTNASGNSVMNPAVPIPAAVYLFGSGLLGLVGLRRKMAA